MVFQREVRASSRRWGTYWSRVFAGAFGAIVLFQEAAGFNAGRNMFFTGVTLAFIAAIFEGVRRGAGALADERTEGTLGLLLLTPLKGPNLIFGKFAAIALAALQTGIAILPVLAASLLLGGVSAGEFLRSTLALAYTLSLVIAISLIASARNDDTVRIMTRTWAVLLLGALILMIVNQVLTHMAPQIRWLNPMWPVLGITDGYYLGAPFSFWASLLLWQIFAFASLYVCGRNLFYNWRRAEETAIRAIADAPRAGVQTSPHVVPARIRDTPRWFKGNPIAWLTLRDMGMHSGRWGALVITLLGAAVVLILPPTAWFFLLLGGIVLVASLCVTSTRVIAKLRESGALELLITTPLGDKGIIKGHREGLAKMFRWLFATIYITTAILYFRGHAGDDGEAIYILVALMLLVWAVPWIGTFFGLKSKSPRRAIVWTIFVVLIIPRVGCFILDPFYFPIVGLIARHQVKKHFRRFAADRFTT